MSREQYISWTVSQADLATSPLGYAVELRDDALVSPVSAKHSTFEETGEFEVSIGGDGVFEAYPPSGLVGATTSTVVRMLRMGETPSSVLMIGNDSFLYKMSLDGKRIMGYRQVCETNSYSIDSVSCDSAGNIWVKDTGGVITVLDRWLRILNTFRVPQESLFAAVDPFRRVIWIVSPKSVSVRRSQDMTVVASAVLPFEVSSVYGWDFSAPSGTLFMTVDGDRQAALAVSLDGSIIEFSPGATGVCQWGAKGALACVPSLDQVDVFDGTEAYDHFHGSSVDLLNPTRIASVGHGHAIVVDSAGTVAKINDQWDKMWLISKPVLWDNIDIRETGGSDDSGGVTYLFSTNGVASYRDMLDEGLQYGQADIPIVAGKTPYPVAAVVPALDVAHIWASIKAISSDDI